MSYFSAVYRDPLCPHLLQWGSPRSHAYNYRLLYAAEFPAHTSSVDLSLELQVHTLASYSLFLLGMLSTQIKINISETEYLISSPQSLLHQPSHPFYISSGQESWILLFLSHSLLFLQEMCLRTVAGT